MVNPLKVGSVTERLLDSLELVLEIGAPEVKGVDSLFRSLLHTL